MGGRSKRQIVDRVARELGLSRHAEHVSGLTFPRSRTAKEYEAHVRSCLLLREKNLAVAAQRAQALARAEKRAASVERKRTHGGVVYFIQSGERGPIKIGKANDAASRMRELQVGSPARLRLLATVPGGHAMETRLHRRFSRLRVSGEWFEPEPELLAHIASIRAGAT